MNKKWSLTDLSTGLGLASNSYLPALRAGELTEENLISWAAEKGFSWLELRDTHVEISRERLETLRDYAATQGVRIHYAWDNPDLTAPDERFLRGIENAALFGPGTHCRVVVAPQEVDGKPGYSAEAFKVICSRVAEYNQVAAQNGVKLCFENSKEPVCGDGKTYFGMGELLDACPGMCSTLDAANFTCSGTVVNPTEEALLEYIQAHRQAVCYFHLKTTRDRAVQSALELCGDFNVRLLLSALAKAEQMLVCLELPPQRTLAEMNTQVEKSLQLLVQAHILG